MDYPSGEKVSYGYDAGGQITSITGTHLGTTFNYVSNIGYDEFGSKVFIKYGNGVETNYTYEPVRRWLSGLNTANQSKGLVFQDTAFDFDAVGNVNSINNKANPKGFTQTYTYDDLYQLKSAVGSYYDKSINNGGIGSTYSQNFTYDSSSNLTKKQSSGSQTPSNIPITDLSYTLDYQYDPAHPHRASKIGNEFYNYDAVGNLTSITLTQDGGEVTAPVVSSITPDTNNHASANTAFGAFDAGPTPVVTPPSNKVAQFDWDTENRLTHSIMRGIEAWYTYDSSGQRISKRSTQSQTLYPDKSYQETITAYPIQSITHIFLGTQRIASKVGLAGQNNGSFEANNTFYYHADHIGSM